MEKVKLPIVCLKKELFLELFYDDKRIVHFELLVAIMIFPETEHNELIRLSSAGLLRGCFEVGLCTHFGCGLGRGVALGFVPGFDFFRLAEVAPGVGLFTLFGCKVLEVRVLFGLYLETPADVILRVALGAVLLGAWRVFWIVPKSLLFVEGFLAKSAIYLSHILIGVLLTGRVLLKL